MRKKLLIGVTSTLLLVGVFFLLTPFLSSLEPSVKAKTARSQHNIATLSLGDYILEPYSRNGNWEKFVLIIKDWDGAIYVHLLPTENEKISMPERWWGWNFYDCNDFGPEISEANKIIPDGNIICHDKTLTDWQKKQWAWDYKGESKVFWIENMHSKNYEISGEFLYVNS